MGAYATAILNHRIHAARDGIASSPPRH
jgi:hypothetical protein